MKITLEGMEVHNLQDVCREPGKYEMENKFTDLLRAGLVELSIDLGENGSTKAKLFATSLGKQVLKEHLPINTKYMDQEVMPEHMRDQARVRARVRRRWY